jgi:hypothetical protein
MHDKYRKRLRTNRADQRLRRQIATEAARRLLGRMTADADPAEISRLTAAELAHAKRQGVAVLGQRVRESDLPSDSDVREQLLSFLKSRSEQPEEAEPEPGDLARLADHLDRFAIYKLRLEPLHDVKLNPRTHPEGDALFHSLQLFEHARAARPFDEEFLLAALLHEVGRAIDREAPAAAALAALEGTISERTAWLIEHLPETLPGVNRMPSVRNLNQLRRSEHFPDLDLLRELDLASRVPGAAVPTVDESIDYIRQLAGEAAHDAGEDA